MLVFVYSQLLFVFARLRRGRLLRLQPRFDNSVEAVSPPCQRTAQIVPRRPDWTTGEILSS